MLNTKELNQQTDGKNNKQSTMPKALKEEPVQTRQRNKTNVEHTTYTKRQTTVKEQTQVLCTNQRITTSKMLHKRYATKATNLDFLSECVDGKQRITTENNSNSWELLKLRTKKNEYSEEIQHFFETKRST